MENHITMPINADAKTAPVIGGVEYLNWGDSDLSPDISYLSKPDMFRKRFNINTVEPHF